MEKICGNCERSGMMSDLINRQEAIDIADRECQEFRGIFSRIEDAIKSLPTIERRPQGKWEAEYTDTRGYTSSFQCSCCYRVVNYPGFIKAERIDYDYCPYCGADMRGEN